MTMLEDLRRSGVRQILIISGEEDPVPSGLKDLWASGFRSFLTFASDLEAKESALSEWLGRTDGITAVSLYRFPTSQFIENIVERYSQWSRGSCSLGCVLSGRSLGRSCRKMRGRA